MQDKLFSEWNVTVRVHRFNKKSMHLSVSVKALSNGSSSSYVCLILKLVLDLWNEYVCMYVCKCYCWQHNTVSRATCCPRATGWAHLPYDVSKAKFYLSTCLMFIWPWPENLESASDIFSTSSDLIISPPWLGFAELDNDVSFDGAEVTTVTDIFFTSAVLITDVWRHMMAFPSLHNYRLFLTSRCLFKADCSYLF